MTMLRFPANQKVGDRLYRRLDGTLSYFFSKEALLQLAGQAGFSVVSPGLKIGTYLQQWILTLVFIAWQTCLAFFGSLIDLCFLQLVFLPVEKSKRVEDKGALP
jgi:hypothetical protein